MPWSRGTTRRYPRQAPRETEEDIEREEGPLPWSARHRSNDRGDKAGSGRDQRPLHGLPVRAAAGPDASRASWRRSLAGRIAVPDGYEPRSEGGECEEDDYQVHR